MSHGQLMPVANLCRVAVILFILRGLKVTAVPHEGNLFQLLEKLLQFRGI